jgi:uncharacterized protein YdeI (YjbR/CyaY-like superfamily)
VSPTPRPHDVRYFATPEELRDWFDEHHETAEELWLGYYRKATGKPSVDWPRAVDEALCVGWIDGVRYSLDDERHAQRFTPRRRGSIWSAVNVRKATALIEAGRMRPAGQAAFDARRDDRTAIYSHERTPEALTAEETTLFRADDAAYAFWQAQPSSYRRAATHWITSAKRPETRARRLGQLIEASRAGERPAPFRFGRTT